MSNPPQENATDQEVKLPLGCVIANGVLTISVNAATVKFATENHPTFWDAETDTYMLKVADPAEWLRSVAFHLTDESEDGSTLLTKLFDDAIERAAEQGEEGLVDE